MSTDRELLEADRKASAREVSHFEAVIKQKDDLIKRKDDLLQQKEKLLKVKEDAIGAHLLPTMVIKSIIIDGRGCRRRPPPSHEGPILPF